MKIEIGSNEEDRQKGFLHVDTFGQPDLRADIRSLPFRHSVDYIYASHVLEHVADVDIVPTLKSCRAALKPEGVLELYVPDLMWIMRRFLAAGSHGARWALWNRFLFGSQENEGQFHRTGFSVKRLSDCLVAAGFRKVDVKRRKRDMASREPFGHESRSITTLEIHAIATA